MLLQFEVENHRSLRAKRLSCGFGLARSPRAAAGPFNLVEERQK
jgi:hypothetical protein